MRAGIISFAAAAGMLLATEGAPQAASAGKVVQRTGGVQTEMSAQRRYRRAHVRVYRPYHPGYAAYPVNDPSLGYFPTLRRLQAEGRCVTDEGYGRFSFCDW